MRVVKRWSATSNSRQKHPPQTSAFYNTELFGATLKLKGMMCAFWHTTDASSAPETVEKGKEVY